MPDARGILFLNNFAGPGLGGGEVQLLNVVRACVGAGMDVTVACPPHVALAGVASDSGARGVEIDFAPRRFRATVHEVRSLACELGAAIVHGSGYYTNLIARVSAPPGSFAIDLVQVELGASLHDGGSHIALGIRNLFDRGTRGKADVTIAVSDAVARSLAATGVAAESVRVIRNAIDADAVRAAATRSAIPELSPRPLVLCASRLSQVKGVEFYVRAVGEVARAHPEAHFVAAGAGPLEARLREIAVAHEVGDKLRFLGHVSPIEPLLAACDVFVMPSLSEGLPIAPLEAMALGKPVVASRAGGLPEVVEDGVTGMLVPPADPRALADAISSVLADPARAASMGEAGRKRIEAEFTIEHMAEAYLKLYAELLGRS